MKAYFNNGHLNDEGLALYAEALKFNKVDELPPEIVEHIEECEECHAKAMELYTIIADIDYSNVGAHPTFEAPAEKKPAIITRLSIAALIVAASYCAFIFFSSGDNVPPSIIPNNTPIQALEDSIQSNQSNENPTAELEQSELKANPKPADIPQDRQEATQEQLALAYAINDDLEDLAGEFTRSDGLIIEKPANEATFKVGQFISFAWQQDAQRTLNLIILDNQDEEKLNIKVDNNLYQYEQQLTPGLYYWKVESEDDLLYVGKFLIR